MKTFFMVKPDGVERNLVGEIISRVESKGFKITKMKMMTISKELAEEHYKEHVEKPFFGDLVNFITSGPGVESLGFVAPIKFLIWVTTFSPWTSIATPGSIRGDLATELDKNVVHGSDSEESASRELSIFFGN